MASTDVGKFLRRLDAGYCRNFLISTMSNMYVDISALTNVSKFRHINGALM